MKLQIDFSLGGSEVLDRVIEAYGFKTKLALAEHLGIASSSLANRYKRDYFPSDVVVRCMAETGANLNWLAAGVGDKFGEYSLNTLIIPRKKITDGSLIDLEPLVLDKTLNGLKTKLINPLSVELDDSTYVLERDFKSVNDGEWLVEIEGSSSIKQLTFIPVKSVRVQGHGTSFDCPLEHIEIIAKVALTIK